MLKTNPLTRKEINKLVKCISQGDSNALRILYERLYKLIFHFLLQITNNKELIKDSIQKTFEIIILKTRTKILYINCFGWILSIARKTLYNMYRKCNKLNLTNQIENIANKNKNNSTIHLGLKMELEKLNKNELFLLYLLFFENLNYKDISIIMKISTSTIKRRKAELLRILKINLSD